MPDPSPTPPVPPIPDPDPKATIAAALLELLRCYPDDEDIQDLVNAGMNADCLSLGDVLGLFALAAAKAACNAKNPDPTCCEADPFIVDNLIVNNASETDTLTVTGDATFNNLTIGGSLCVAGIPQDHLIGTDRIIAQDTGGCFKSFPKSDLDPYNLHLPGFLEVDGTTILHGTLHVGGDSQFDGDVAVDGNLFVGGQICVSDLNETDFTADCKVVVWKAGCLYTLPVGTCCFDDPPPDPDPPVPPDPPPPITCPLLSIPAVPPEFVPVGADATRELAVFRATNPTPVGGWKLETPPSIGPIELTGYPQNTRFALYGTSGAPPTLLGEAYYYTATPVGWHNTARPGVENFDVRVLFYTTGVVTYFIGHDDDYAPPTVYDFNYPVFACDVYSGNECQC